MKKSLLILSLASSCIFASTLEEIQSNKNIRIGVRYDLPPFSSKNDNGDFEGFEIELAKKIGKSIVGENGTITFVPLNANERISALEENKVDLSIAYLSKTKERENKIDFSIPYMSNTLAVITKKSDAIKSKDEIKNKRIVYPIGTTIEKYILENDMGSQKIPCTSNSDCLAKIQNNEADAYIRTNVLIAQLPLIDDSIEMSIKSLGPLDYTCVGIAKNNEKLKKAVDKEILALAKSGFFAKSYETTFEPFYKGTLDKKFILLDSLYKNMF